MDAVLTCLVSDNLGPGSLTDRRVAAVSEYLNLAGGIALRERARAFSLALDELALEPGSRVVLDPLVPHAYHREIVRRGLIAHYVDVSPGTVVLDATAIEQIAEGVAAIVASCHLGFVPDLERIAALGVPIVEDISDGFGAHTGVKRAGEYGRYVILAMEPDGIITAGGGTLLLTAGKRERAGLRRQAETLPRDTLLPDMNAALGTTQIREIEKFLLRRNEIAAVYSRALMRGRHRGIVQAGDAEPVAFTFPVLVEGAVAEVVSYARKKGVEVEAPFTNSVLDRYANKGARNGEARGDDAAGGDFENAGVIDDGIGADGMAERPGHTLVEDDYPAARSMLLRCIHFPLYPSLSGKEVETIERVIVSLP